MTEKDKSNSIWLAPLVLDRGFGVEFREDHVHVDLGKNFKVNSKVRNSLWAEIGRLCEEHGTRRVLAEGILPTNSLPTMEVVDAGLKTATVPKLWLAFCVEPFERTEQTELYETVAASKGVRVKFFGDRERALKWLRTNTPS